MGKDLFVGDDDVAEGVHGVVVREARAVCVCLYVSVSVCEREK